MLVKYIIKVFLYLILAVMTLIPVSYTHLRANEPDS